MPDRHSIPAGSAVIGLSAWLIRLEERQAPAHGRHARLQLGVGVLPALREGRGVQRRPLAILSGVVELSEALVGRGHPGDRQEAITLRSVQESFVGSDG